MALTKEITVELYGKALTFHNAYIVVNEVSASKDIAKATLLYFSEAGGEVFDRKAVDFVPDMNGENFIKQAYLHLKSTPEFAHSEDA